MDVGTTTVPSAARPYSRGGPIFRWLYARWRQLLAFVDLLGADGRVSATKFLAFITAMSVLLSALTEVFTRMAVRAALAWQGKVEALADQTAPVWTPTMFWILFLCFCVLFGRWGLTLFKDVFKEKWSGSLTG